MAFTNGNASYDLPTVGAQASWRRPSLDLFPRIINISPTDYPFFTHTDNVTTNNVTTEWQYRRLPARDYTAAVKHEGETYSYRAIRKPTAVSNTCMILGIGVELTGTAAAGDYFGVGSLMNDQVNDALETLKGHTEHAYIRSVETVGGDSDERQMDGLLAAITTNATSFANSSLSEAQFKGGLQMVWTYGPKARAVMVPPSMQKVIDLFDANGATKFVDTTAEGVVSFVQYVKTAFGAVQVLISRDLVDTTSGAEMVFIDFRTFHKAWYRKTQMKKVAPQGDVEQMYVVQEHTLKYDDEAGAAKFTALKHT